MNSEPKSAMKFDHEKLDVYQLELKFIGWVAPLLEAVSNKTKGRTREICDQLDRASLSVLLNTAEGNGRRQRPTRAKFFDDARGSATECAACLDALVAKQVITVDQIEDGKVLLLRIVSMLSRLVERFDSGAQLHEDTVAYCIGGLPDPAAGTTGMKTRTTTRARTGTI